MEIIQEIEYQAELLRWLDDKLKVPLPVDPSTYQSIGCFDMTIEHVGSIILLSSSELYGSMFALMRVAFESLGRGLWLRHCATAKQRAAFTRGRLDVTFADLLKQVEAAVGTSGGPLSSLQAGTWKVMNDYTHTGIQQIRSRHSQQTVTGTYPLTNVVAALRIAGLWALLAGSELASYAAVEELIVSIQARATEYGRHWA